MKNPIESLLEKDFHIVEKRKILFAIPLAIVLIAAILMIIFNFTLGSPLNLGTDFTGGYTVDVQLPNKLTDENFGEYRNRIYDLFEEITTEDGNTYSVRIDGIQRQGSGASSAIHVKYFAVRGVSESEMLDQVNPAIQKKIEESVLLLIPKVDISGKTITLTYGEVLSPASLEIRKTAFSNLLKDELRDIVTVSGEAADAVKLNPDNNKQIVIECETVASTDEVKSALAAGMKISDSWSGQVVLSGAVGATVSTELIFNAVLAVALALVFMLCYIGLRFQLSSGLACIIALFHDIIIMFSFMAICRIEINNTFIAALITILGYSINNSIIVFDRVRENKKSIFNQNMSAADIANKSVKETLMRSINTTITTLIMIVMVAILGVSDIQIFALPIIMGLISGTFSSICIAPSLWALFQNVGKKKKNGLTKKEKGLPAAQTEANA
ncbi:MAG: protein translocase subunit SecF [Clostridiales bacterium]|nr:protein translocase subunit SecF [Clostridiales bacterium]